eukprot:1745656-Rhodomonas_salina.3
MNEPIQHAMYCSAAALDGMQPLATVATHAASARAIRAAVNILVINDEGKVLLTRRGKAMRGFPGFWVLPCEQCNPADARVTGCPVLTSRMFPCVFVCIRRSHGPKRAACEVASPLLSYANATGHAPRCPALTY